MTLSVLDDFNNASMGASDLELNSTINLNEFTIDMFSKDNVLNKSGNLVNKVPLIYYVEDNLSDSKTKKRFVIKLGKDSVYKSASEELFDTVGQLGSRSNLYDQDQE